MDNFVPNPTFMSDLKRATSKALEDSADEAVKQAQTDIRSFSSGAARAVKRYPARLTGSEPAVPITIGKGLGRIFEFSKQQNRRTKGRGAKQKYGAGINRGVMQRHEFFHKAIEDQQRRGLDLRRYL